MLINWFTVCAQIINFLVLVWLLKKVLYKPILQMIKDRQDQVAKQLNDAAVKKAEAEKAAQEFAKKNAEFEQYKAARLEKLEEEMKTERSTLQTTAQQDVQAQRTKWLQRLAEEKAELLHDVGQKIEAELFSIMRKALQDLANANIQDQAIHVFFQRLKQLPANEKAELVATITAAPKVTIKTAKEVSEHAQEQITTALQEELGIEVRPQFVVVPELIIGVALVTKTQKVSWTLAEYLTSLQQVLKEGAPAHE